MIQGAGFHLNQNFVCFDGWIERVGVFQNFRPAVLVEDDSFHVDSATGEHRFTQIGENGIRKMVA
jgi:hypothetical protein